MHNQIYPQIENPQFPRVYFTNYDTIAPRKVKGTTTRGVDSDANSIQVQYDLIEQQKSQAKKTLEEINEYTTTLINLASLAQQARQHINTLTTKQAKQEYVNLIKAGLPTFNR